jgi:outer membrane receptor protein involved in Fe transport
LAAVERIEVLRDGAAAQYGSDAIAGVINIVLKKNYNGLSFSEWLDRILRTCRITADKTSRTD